MVALNKSRDEAVPYVANRNVELLLRRMGFAEVTQRLRVLAPLPENLDPVLSTNMEAHNYLQLRFRGSPFLSSVGTRHICATGTQTYRQAKQPDT